MEISANPSDWTSVDSENLSKFLDTDTGKRLLPKIAEAAPLLHDGGEVNRILIRTGELRGFQTVLREILSLAHPAPPVQQSNGEYPNLFDDKGWEGPKLSDPNPKIL